MKAVLLISHGSHSPKTKDEVIALIKRLIDLCTTTNIGKEKVGKPLSRVEIFEYAFLEIESPSIPDGIDRCVGQGATDLTILLNFLNSGRHVNEDIPRIVSEAKQKYPDVKFRITPPVGQHPKIDELFVELINSLSPEGK